MHNPKVNIIILHFRNFSILSECLQSSQKISYPDYDITVVNNGSSLPLNIAPGMKLLKALYKQSTHRRISVTPAEII